MAKNLEINCGTALMFKDERVTLDRLLTQDLMAKLPPNLREPLRLKYFERMNATEIGKELNLCPTTVRTRIKAALMFKDERVTLDRVLTQDLMAKLPPNLREPLRLKYFERMNATEIGKELNLCPATVRTRIRTALLLLRCIALKFA
jgi:DNA-directed RNA polymerase specialized sigma24 family protein